MKSNRKKRVLAAILCMVMVMTNNVSVLAEGEVNTEVQVPEAVPETVSEDTETGTDIPEQNESEIPESPQPDQSTPETPIEPEAPTEPETPAVPEQPTPEIPAEPEAPTEPETPAVPEQPTPETPAAPEQTEPVFSEAMEFTQEFRDSAGNLVQKITAKLPAGAFEAETSAITMEVNYVNASSEEYLKGLMTKKLPEGNELGDYFLYKIEFKVNGEAKTSLKPIEITFAKSDLEVKDTKKANVFYLDPADPAVSGDKDEIVEITQRSELIESFQAAGKSTANIDEEYDLSTIEVGSDQKSGKIVLEGRKSTIYGCYVEKEPESIPEAPQAEEPDGEAEATPEEPENKEEPQAELKYEDDQVVVSVTESAEGAIPEGATLKVVPITSEDTETKEQYEEVEKKIQEKVAEEDKVVAGFLAYDITFVDAEGNEIEPNGKVKVSMNYKKPELPEEVKENGGEDAEVSVLHLEEDETGNVKKVVDMNKEETTKVDTLTTTEGPAVQNVEAETESFSAFVITWTDNKRSAVINVHYIDETGSEIPADSVDDIELYKNDKINFDTYKQTIAGYEFKEFKIEPLDKIITNSLYMRYDDEERRIQYSSDGKKYNDWLELQKNKVVQGDVYLVYTLIKNTDSAYCYTENGEKIQDEPISLKDVSKESVLKEFAPEIENYMFSRVIVNKDNENLEVKKLQMTDNGLQYSVSDTEIKWEDVDRNEVRFLYYPTVAYCYTENGDKINGESVNLKTIQEETKVQELAPNINQYEFLYVVVIKNNTSVEVKRLRTVEGKLQYSVAETGDVWEDVGIGEVRYTYRVSAGAYPTIATANTAGLIDIALYDYEKNAQYSGLLFDGNGDQTYNKWIGYWGVEEYRSNDKRAVQGIMDRSLYTKGGQLSGINENYQGYPKVIAGGNSQVATKLFNNPVASDLNHLFIKDAQGYYEYNSREHYAYYDTTGNVGKNFVVYQDSKDKGQDNAGDFMPLKNITENQAEWYYGMTVGFNFIQPEGGSVEGNPMVFEFSGDDDVWVFVDGKLVLDIGGIHGAVGGSINFQTGQVKVNDVVSTSSSGLTNTIGQTTTLKNIFELEGDTFEDYTEHRVEFFYLERGAGESNCHLRFNMPPVPKDSLQVRKEITNTDKEKYANVEFSFQVYLETEQDSGKYQILPDGTQYQIYVDNTPTDQYGTIQNGIFKLKHGQSAVFKDISRNLKYYAVETEISSDEFDKVEVPGWGVSYEDEHGNLTGGTEGEIEPGKTFIAKSEPKRVGGNSVIIFKNRCSAANQRELWITKQMAEGQTAADNETFAFQLYLEGTDGNFVQYGAGNKYYVVTGDGTTESLEPQTIGPDGIISGIKPGQSIVLTQILSGTEFRVEEVELDNSKYYEPEKTVNSETCEEGTITDENGVLISDGTIALNKDAKVTVTNKKRSLTFNIKKVDFEDNNVVLPNAEFELEKLSNGSWTTVRKQLRTDEKGIVTVSDLENGHYKIIETDAPEGYIGTAVFEFDLPYTKTDDSTVEVKEDSKLPDNTYGEITKTVTNQKQNWGIVKRSSSDNQLKVAGAKFKLEQKNVENPEEAQVYYGLSSGEETSKGKVMWYSDIQCNPDSKIEEKDIKPGEYRFQEIEAPSGYALNTETWSITIGVNGSLSKINKVSLSGNEKIAEENKEISGDHTTVTYYFENTPVYDLPSAGGSGIFGYTISGTLLLMAAALILYKMKNKGVLKG